MSIPAGIVLFNPDITRLTENLNSIAKYVSCVYIVDNGSDNRAEIQKLLEEYENVLLHINQKNEGIAKALNQLCESALTDGYQHLITLDQDSVCPENLVLEYQKYLSDSSIGLVCPLIRDRNVNFEKQEYFEEATEVDHCITSASMLSLRVWEEVNGFDESMYIDGVDFDFGDRVRKCGKKIIRLNKVVLLHEIGHIQERRFLFFKTRVKNHSAFRKYYIARNTVYLARKRGSRRLYIKSYFQVAKQAGMVLLYESEKKQKLSNIWRGMIDGASSKLESKWCE